MPPFFSVASVLVLAQRDDRIDARGADRRQQAGLKARREQDQRDDAERERIEGGTFHT